MIQDFTGATVSTLPYTGIATKAPSHQIKGNYQRVSLFLSPSLGMIEVKAHSPTLRQRQRRLTFVLLCVWLSGRFGPAFFARTLYFELAGWPVHFWMAAHGSIFAFNIIVVAYAWSMN